MSDMARHLDPDTRREAVAEAVWALVERGGVDALTVREVARQAGVSTGLLAHYFSSKDELLTFAMNLAFDRVAQRMLTASQQRPALAALRAICLENMPLDDTRRTEYHAWLFFWSRAASRPALSADHARRYGLWRAAIKFLVEQGKDDGSIRAECDASQEAELLTAFIDGIGLQAVFEPDRLDPAHLSALLDAYLGRLARPQIPSGEWS